MVKKILLFISISIILSSCVVDQEEFQRTQNRVYSLNNYTIKLNQKVMNLEKKVNSLSKQVEQIKKTQLAIKAQQTLKYNELFAEIKSLKNELYDQKKLRTNSNFSDANKGTNEVTKEAIKDIYSKIFSLENEIKLLKNSSKKQGESIKYDDRYYYKRAYSLFTSGKYSKAEKAFRDFIEKFKKSSLIPNAHYWLGECYYKRKMYEKAIIEYDEVIVKYPKSPKVPAALLKEGISFYNIGEKDGARLIFKKILKDYPKSAQAKYAKEYLRKLRK